MSTLLPEIGHFREASRAEGPKQATSRLEFGHFRPEPKKGAKNPPKGKAGEYQR